MKTLIVLIFFFSNLIIAQNSAWSVVHSSPQLFIADLHFVSADTGFAVGEDKGTILRTLDGGNNWDEFKTSNNSVLRSVFFINNNGFVVGGSVTGGTSSRGLLLRTTDYGDSWEELYNFSHYSLEKVYFYDDQTGFILGLDGTIFKTIDGGITWDSVHTGITDYLYDIFFINENIGWLCADWSLYKTTNGGISWFKIQEFAPFEIYFADENRGWVFTMGNVFSGHIRYTTDGGINWTFQLSTPYSNNINSFHMINEKKGCAVGAYGQIWFTINSGEDWIQVESPTDKHLFSVFFADESVGYAAGRNGTIIKTNSGGIVNTQDQLNPVFDYQLYQNYPNPFNPVTTIKYKIPENGFVSIKVLDFLGREIAALVNEEKQAGTYEVEFNSNNLASGVYFYCLQAGSFIQTNKMMILK